MGEIQESLKKLTSKSDQELHEITQRVRRKCGTAEWEMGLCLEVAQSRRSFQNLGYSSLDDYAERALALSRKDVYRLLSTTRALLHLPRLSEAYRQGQLSWASLRALQSVVTPETEVEWLEFALRHGSDEVARRVAMTPAEWKRQQGLNASLESQPIVTPEMVQTILETESVGTDGPPPQKRDDSPTTQEGRPRSDPAGDTSDTNPGSPTKVGSPPLAPKMIRLTFDLTPDQYAIYETAQRRIRDQAGKHISRAAVLTAMSERILSSGSSRARAKYQILLLSGDQEHFYYDTDQGPLPVGPQALQNAREQQSKSAPGSSAESKSGPEKEKPTTIGEVRPDEVSPCLAGNCPQTSAPTRLRTAPANPENGSPREGKRVPIPAATLRSLYARAKSRCEICGGRAYLQVHHKTPVSEGGSNNLEDLELRCGVCHDHGHLDDYQRKPGWRGARSAAMRKRKRYREGPEDRWLYHEFSK